MFMLILIFRHEDQIIYNSWHLVYFQTKDGPDVRFDGEIKMRGDASLLDTIKISSRILKDNKS